MNKKNLLIISLNTLICAFISSSQAQETCSYDNVNAYPYYSNNADITDNYDTMDYYYNYRQVNGYQGFNREIHFGRTFDNSNNFSSGISSYQGTSTGPGPNGGYPGTPRGIYPTNYIPR